MAGPALPYVTFPGFTFAAAIRSFRLLNGDFSLMTRTKPGECVSVDQMISETPGLIAQLRGIPTVKQYKCVTTFVDQFTKYGFTFVQISANGDESVAAKLAFEVHLQSMGVQVQQYQADNGIFASLQHNLLLCEELTRTLLVCMAFAIGYHFPH